MKSDFYEYTTLNINPLDDLLEDTHSIRKKLGKGLTSMVYSLEKKENNYSGGDSKCCAMKVSRCHEYSEHFLNEFQITKQLNGTICAVPILS